MGFENIHNNNEKPTEIDKIIEALNNGEIKPGEKGIRKIELTDGIIGTYDKYSKNLSFVYRGILTNVTIENNKVASVDLANPHTNEMINDNRIAESRKQYIQKLLDERQLILPYTE